MTPTRLFVLTAVFAALAAPVASRAADEPTAATPCAATSMTPAQRRITEEAARGLPMLIGFVNISQPIYQLRVVDAVAWLDAERARRAECTTASAR